MKMICKIISRLWQTGLAVGFLLATGVVAAIAYKYISIYDKILYKRLFYKRLL